MIGDTTLWQSLPMPILTVTDVGLITGVNPSAEMLLGRSNRSVSGKMITAFLNIDGGFLALTNRLTAGGERLYADKAASLVEMRAGALSFHLIKHEAEFLLVFDATSLRVHDLSVKAPKRAAKSAIGMAEMLAHEIKNPLAGITGAAQLLEMSLQAEDRELTGLIVEECRRIVTLLDEVEQFGDLRRPNLAAVNVHDILDRARKMAAVGFAAHMTFKDDFDPSLPDCFADGDQLMQVFLNLIKNAAEAQPDGGEIRLRSFYDPSMRRVGEDGQMQTVPLQIEIIDNGPGLPADIQDQVFDPFVSGRENGSGLGLALVSKIIEQHQGWITVDSTVGRTTFKVSLPRPPKSRATSQVQ
ncbi:MAG: two-component system sensor histidine kinase NtrB [Halocynthiibacter sp.]